MKLTDNRFAYSLILLFVAAIIRFFLVTFLNETNAAAIRVLDVIIIIGVGAFFVLRGTANIIEETTEVLSERTKLAGGFLQSLGTAFPDMILGIIAAIISLQLRSTDYLASINYAIIAAATTFGSNIYNIGHAAWSIFRQNLANDKDKSILMFPGIRQGGTVKPITKHRIKPTLGEFDTAIDVATALTILTALVALSMVLFGQVTKPPPQIKETLYQLIQPIGAVVFVAAVYILYYFRKTRRPESPVDVIVEEEKYYRKKSNLIIWSNLVIAGAAILFAAEAMVRSIDVLSAITGIPYVIAGALAGIIGSLGEIIVVHNFTVNPNGRIGDAVVGVAMDNIVTILGASIVAIIGGIYLGSNALVVIFVIILSLNTVLVWQISRLKNYFLPKNIS